MSVTLGEVARLSGVSLTTASRVLNGSNRSVSEELAARVRSCAERLGYLPNAPAQALARSSTATVGVLLHDVADPYFAAIARGACDAAVSAGMLPLVVNTDGDPLLELRGIRMLHTQRVRAIVLAGSAFTDATATGAITSALGEYRTSGGSVATITDHGPAYPAVLPDNRRGAAELARALLGLGHRRIAVITGPERLRVAADRLAGVLDVLAGAGAAPGEEAVERAEFSREGGRAAMGRLLDRLGAARPTAVLALSDVSAIGAMAELRRRGIDVPGEVSLAGFDDIPLAADLVPALSTVRMPLERMGGEAVRLALDTPDAGGPRRVPLRVEVVLRDTTAAPRQR